MKYFILLTLAACGKPGVTWSESGSPTKQVDPIQIPPGKGGPTECTPVLVQVPLTPKEVMGYTINYCVGECKFGWTGILYFTEGIHCICKKAIPHHPKKSKFSGDKNGHND